VLGDDPARPTFIQTVARRGYRFIAPVTNGSPDPHAPAPRPHPPRETARLDAYRLVNEGRVRLESLDSAAIPGAIADFQQAIELDPGYAPPYIGLRDAPLLHYS